MVHRAYAASDGGRRERPGTRLWARFDEQPQYTGSYGYRHRSRVKGRLSRSSRSHVDAVREFEKNLAAKAIREAARGSDQVLSREEPAVRRAAGMSIGTGRGMAPGIGREIEQRGDEREYDRGPDIDRASDAAEGRDRGERSRRSRLLERAAMAFRAGRSRSRSWSPPSASPNGSSR